MKLLLLWAPLADYTVACLKALSIKLDIQLYLIYQPEESNAPYEKFDLSFTEKSLPYSKENEKVIKALCLDIRPDFIIMSSWNYSFYMSISKECRKYGSYVISTFDGQWEGTLRQRLGILSSRFFLKPSIDNFFVPGDRQATLARKLGYNNPWIGYYCANTDRFPKETVKETIPKCFIFVGRLVQVKGIDILLNAYRKYRVKAKEPWDLLICGKGKLEYLCQQQTGVTLTGFRQPHELPQLFLSGGCFILPSYHEPWGLVIHEAAIAGLPIITSYKCGASTFYVRDGQNGFVINPDEESLLDAMLNISRCSENDLKSMSRISKNLGDLWTVEKWADYVYSHLKYLQNELMRKIV